jgi:hypothetical protein
MSEEDKNSYVGSEENGGIKIIGPISTKDANSNKINIEGKENKFAFQTHAKNPGQAILKILSAFINREKHGIK